MSLPNYVAISKVINIIILINSDHWLFVNTFDGCLVWVIIQAFLSQFFTLITLSVRLGWSWRYKLETYVTVKCLLGSVHKYFGGGQIETSDIKIILIPLKDGSNLFDQPFFFKSLYFDPPVRYGVLSIWLVPRFVQTCHRTS